MRLVFGIVVACCLNFAAAGLLSQQQETPPAAPPAGHDGRANAQAPPAEKPAPGETAPPDTPKPEAKPDTGTETKTEPQSETKTEPKGEPGGEANHPNGQPSRQAESEPKKKAGRTTAPAKHRGKRARTPDGGPRKIVIREGGTDEPAAEIVSGMTPEETSRQRQDAEHLLISTGAIVKQLAGRSLDAQQRETVSQIANYMEGARSALKEGDIARGHTLAEKASLLADDLAKH